MINNLKLGIKIFRYGSGWVSMMVCSGIFLVLGLLMNIGYDVLEIAGRPGDIFLLFVAVCPIQILYSLSASNFIASSPAKKRMQTSVTATVCCFNMIVMYLVNFLFKVIMLTGHPENIGTACAEMVSLAGLAVLFMLYLAVAYKCFWMSIVGGIAAYFYTIARLNGLNVFLPEIFENSAGSFALALFIGLVIIVLGGFGQYGLALLVYKLPMSKYAQSATVRKEM